MTAFLRRLKESGVGFGEKATAAERDFIQLTWMDSAKRACMISSVNSDGDQDADPVEYTR